jgi:preprotein translocase subunit SecE
MASEITERDEPQRKRTGPIGFFREVRAEGRKITWATRQETVVSTIMVLIMVVLAALFFTVVDNTLHFAITWVLGLVQ